MKMIASVVAAAVAAAVSCSASAADQTMKCDIVVLGAGVGGTAASYQAAQLGAKVITLEKQPMVGGTGKFSEGIFAVESSMQRDWNYNLTRDQAFKIIMEYSHWRANAKLVRAYVDKSASTIEWMKQAGVKFEKLTNNYPGGLYTWHIYEGRGAGWINLLNKKTQELGGKLLLETPATELIHDKNGRVTGVVARNKDGDKITIEAGAVIIATGGFGGNPEMMKQYQRFPGVDGLFQNGKVGDGIKMAWGMGAGHEGEGVQASYRPGPKGVPTTNQVSATAKQPHLWLTPKGSRFCNEEIMLIWPYAGNALERIGGQMWVVYDNATKNYMCKTDGIDLGVGVMVPVTTKLVKFDTDFPAAEKAGWAVKAATLDELARKTGMDAATLKATVADYNKSCETRHDVFGKDPKYLRTVKEGPFYAIKSVASSLGTLGGIKCNEKLEVVTAAPEEKPIPGLFACGNDVGGMYGDSYDLVMAGSTIAWGANTGRIAAETAWKYVQSGKKAAAKK